jgi:hypothetical protein
VRSFAFSNVNSRDVFIAIHQIGSNAIGLDEVPPQFIKKNVRAFSLKLRIYLILPLHLDASLLHGRFLRFLLKKSLTHLSLGTLEFRPVSTLKKN